MRRRVAVWLAWSLGGLSVVMFAAGVAFAVLSASAQKSLARFGVRLRDETDVSRLGEDLVGVVQETLQPEHVSLWLREPEREPGG